MMLTAAGVRLECARYGPRSPGTTLLFLHDGLGSVRRWRDFPEALAAATALPGLAYCRRGYGGSDPLTAPFDPSFLQRGAGELAAVLEAAAIRSAILVGHSDGASIALIHAASGAPGVEGLVLLAPHVFVEPRTVAGAEQARRDYLEGDLRGRLTRHHGENTEALFAAWSGVWVSQAFRSWSIEALLPAVRCPVLVIQGAEDEYGTRRQWQVIAQRVAGRVETLELPDCRHAPFRDQPQATLAAALRFVRSLRDG